jgi:hypothetical protein
MDEKKILISIPSLRENQDFFSSIFTFINSLKGFYKVSVVIDKWEMMAVLQNRVADYFLQNDFDYLLFCEDDVVGHTKDMLDALIKADAPVAAMQAYQRHYPYPNLLGYDKDSGYGPITLTGHQMLLLRRDAFDKLSKPYFIPQFDGVNAWSTDQLFFYRLQLGGVKIVGCWDYCLTHGGISKENVKEKRNENAPSYIDRVLHAMKNKEK